MISESRVGDQNDLLLARTDHELCNSIREGQGQTKPDKKKKGEKGKKRKMNKNPNLDPKHQPVYKHAESVRHQVV